MASKTKGSFYSEIDEAQLILSRLQLVNEAIIESIMNSSRDEIRLDFADKINVLTDCISMYAERLEKIIEKLNSKKD